MSVDTKLSWSDSMTQKMTAFFEKEHIQTAIRNRVLDPIMNHIMKRIFPYIILICTMFMLLLIAVLLTLGVVIFKFRTVKSVTAIPATVATVATATATAILSE